MAQGTFRDHTNPTFDDLGRREVINLECQCGRIVQLAPYKLIGRNGISKSTAAWSLRGRFRCLKCKRRPPKRMWIAKWQD